ncbi:MaoC family dehydratase [Micromonospora auratinigra]|uniref:Acyl dehydratase n=1 Tax=Micromonospora auratinigra TaxID=261654 RepID=A0A1A8ZUW9_9ACTN|nr:MaoC family dehydratase [Micromonospora auratinigra]SBT47907.1 Acyl dehydratase [Micromonospora auratinigra]
MELPNQTFRVTRADLVRYAGASGDFNPIHWSDRTATKVGLPGVIAHGMFTMALVGRAVAAWAGAPDAVIDFGVRFTRPVVVPDTDEGTEIVVTAVVKETTEAGLTRLDVTATCHGEKVLSQARATVRTPRD